MTYILYHTNNGVRCTGSDGRSMRYLILVSKKKMLLKCKIRLCCNILLRAQAHTPNLSIVLQSIVKLFHWIWLISVHATLDIHNNNKSVSTMYPFQTSIRTTVQLMSCRINAPQIRAWFDGVAINREKNIKWNIYLFNNILSFVLLHFGGIRVFYYISIYIYMW